MSFFRYPGGKGKIKKNILPMISDKIAEGEDIRVYAEPFIGGGSILVALLEKIVSSRDSLFQTDNFNKIEEIAINDKNMAISSIWTCLINHYQDLQERIREYEPEVDDFYEFKDFFLNQNLKGKKSKTELIDIAFKKIVIHQTSYSGLGEKSGSPLGGKEQKSDYKIDCRWSPDYLCKKIDRIGKLLKEVKVSGGKCGNYDFEKFFGRLKRESVIYLDPPYYVKGGELYLKDMSHEDHERLAEFLNGTHHQWILSYDDCEEIRNFYDGQNIEQIEMNYSIAKQTSKCELLITRGSKLPDLS